MKLNDVIKEGFWDTAKAVGAATKGVFGGVGQEIKKGAEALAAPAVRAAQAGAKEFTASKISSAQQILDKAIQEMMKRGMKPEEVEQYISKQIKIQTMRNAGLTDEQIQQRFQLEQNAKQQALKNIKKQQQQKQQ